MSRFLCIAFILSAQLAQAQITITAADMPGVNDELLRANSTIQNFDGNDTGAGHTWDFSMLTPDSFEGDTAVPVSATPLLYQLFFNNGFLYPDHNADYAISGDGFSVQTLTVSDLYDYFKVDNDAFTNVGFGANINGVPTSTQRIPLDEVYELPLNYQNTSSSFSSFEINIPTLLYFKEDQTRSNEVDGWGTLNLPNGSYNVLRVKSTLDRVDSAYVFLISQGFLIPQAQTIEYKWLANGEPEPVLQVVTTGGVVTSVTYKVSVINALPEMEESTFVVSPNPASSYFEVFSNASKTEEFVLFDLSGKRVDSARFRGSYRWNTSALAKGSYVLKSNTGAQLVEIVD